MIKLFANPSGGLGLPEWSKHVRMSAKLGAITIRLKYFLDIFSVSLTRLDRMTCYRLWRIACNLTKGPNSKRYKEAGKVSNLFPSTCPAPSLFIMRLLAQLAFLVVPLATLTVGGTVNRNAEGLSSLTERQVCPCASQNLICDTTLPALCCSGVCAAAVNSLLPNGGTCSCYSSGTACTGHNNCCSGNCVSTNGGPYLCK